MGGFEKAPQTPLVGLYSAVLVLAVGLFSACGGGSDSGDASPSQTPTAESPTTVSTEVPAAPTTTSTTSTPEALSAEEIYTLLSPSIALIETPMGSGSGILVDGGFVVTNYHVVWPFQRFRVVFPDGTEFADVPVVGFDPFADVAVLGPIDVPAGPLSLVDGEGLSPGSELYLIGYPAETDLFPEPTITSGVLSRFRQWELYDLTLLQSDAAIAGGQSGGALVNSLGEVIGISTWSFSEAGFSVATSAIDDAETVGWIIENYQQFGPPDPFSSEESGLEFTVDLENAWDSGLFWFDGVAGSVVDLFLDGPSDGVIIVVGPSLNVVLEVDEEYEGLEYGTLELPVDGPYFVVVRNLAANLNEESSFILVSSAELTPFYDAEDGQALAVGGLVGGTIDHYSDIDWYSIELSEGETIVVWTEAIATDTAVYIGHSEASVLEMAVDDDSGPALFGDSVNAELAYTAPVTGEYYIFVEDPVGTGGSYFLGVDHAEPTAEEEPIAEEAIEDEPLSEPDVSSNTELGLAFVVDSQTTWQDLFDNFEPGEQDCVRQGLDQQTLFADVMAGSVIAGEAPDQAVRSVFECLPHDTAIEIYISVIVASIEEDQVTVDSTHVACFRDAFSGDTGMALFEALISGVEPEGENAEMAMELLYCFPKEALQP